MIITVFLILSRGYQKIMAEQIDVNVGGIIPPILIVLHDFT